MKHPFFSFLAPFFILFFSCDREISNPIQLTGLVFGTTYNIIYYDATVRFDKEINQLFEKINKEVSTYLPTSDISRINNGESGVVIGPFFKEIFFKSKQIHRETQGYFDPTVGNLVNAWGFGSEESLKDPDSVTVAHLMKFVGFEKVDLKDDQIIKKYPETYLDFNSIGKGYGLDLVARFLDSKNVKNYLIEIGGEIRVKGTKTGGKLWTIQLDRPNTDGTRSAYTNLQLTDISMASSGNYRKFRMAPNGKKYVHIINPKTGSATESNLLSATVFGKLDCAEVDAYATAFMAMGLERTKKFLKKKPSLKVLLIYANQEGALVEFRN